MAITDYRKWRTRFLRFFATAQVQKQSVYLDFGEQVLLITQVNLYVLGVLGDMQLQGANARK